MFHASMHLVFSSLRQGLPMFMNKDDMPCYVLRMQQQMMARTNDPLVLTANKVDLFT